MLNTAVVCFRCLEYSQDESIKYFRGELPKFQGEVHFKSVQVLYFWNQLLLKNLYHIEEKKSVSAKKDDKPADETIEPAAEAAQAPAQQQQVKVNDDNVTASYANFCRVSSTPEELILDLGLNPQPLDPANTEINVGQRIILNHYTAKRLLSALSMALQRHEQAFGVLETDIRKRVVRQQT